MVIDNVRLHDYYHAEDAAKVGAHVDGNYNCTTGDWKHECCFCKPNGVRSSQVRQNTARVPVGVFRWSFHRCERSFGRL